MTDIQTENRHDRRRREAFEARGLDPETEPDRAVEPLLYSTQETMRVLTISETTLWRLTRSGKLTACKIGGRNYYRVAEIRAFVETLTSVSTGKEAA